MDKFIKEAELLKTRLSEFCSDANIPHSIVVHPAQLEEYNDVALDVRILVNEFGNMALIEELPHRLNSPDPLGLSYLLGKLIEATKLRSR